jgi:hypothetical protein
LLPSQNNSIHDTIEELMESQNELVKIVLGRYEEYLQPTEEIRMKSDDVVERKIKSRNGVL